MEILSLIALGPGVMIDDWTTSEDYRPLPHPWSE